MGLFDFLRKSKTADGSISPDAYQRKRQAEINALECKYDLSSVEGINAIPVPKKKAPPRGGLQSVTGQIEYYLLIKGGEYETAGEVELALACYRKANELMPKSHTVYQYDSYMRLPRLLRKLRRFDEARAEEAKIAILFPDSGVFQLSKEEFLADMKLFGHSSQKAAQLYLEYCEEREKERAVLRRRAEYDWLWEHLPDLCPKSPSAYSKMKNQNTDKYKELVKEAKKHGFVIK